MSGTIYVGETVGIAVTFKDPLTNQPISDGTAKVELFAPPKNPATVVADRATVDEGPFTLTWNATTSQWETQIDTTGYTSGRWAYRVTHTSAYTALGYYSFTLTA